jgi:D-alanyl-D-alanine carboxypeptidase (penicillin-binding protein 5/6)
MDEAGVDNMKRIISWITAMLVAGALFSIIPVVGAEQPSVCASSAVLMEAQSGRVLFARNSAERRSMASTTKIMTALIAVQSERLDDVVEITREMIEVEGSSIYLKAGEKLTLRALVTGLLLESGNDAANAIAIALAGSKEAFADKMNEYAESLGMQNTHFVTPSGLDDEEHYTTAYDMALLGCAAMRCPDFSAIASQKTMTVDFMEPELRRTFYNHNRLLLELPGCNGVKTGFTKKSGRCLVSSCERDGILLVAVTLNDPDDWNDHKKMMEYGFGQVERVTFAEAGMQITVPVVGAGTDRRTVLKEASPVEAVIPKGRAADIQMHLETEPFLYAPTIPGQVAGRLVYTLDGEPVAELSLVTDEKIDFVERERSWFEKFCDFFRNLFGIG